jgi:hypothetical protein
MKAFSKVKKKNLIVLLLFLVLFGACSKSLPDKVVVYNNNFESGSQNKLTVVNFNGIIDSTKIIRFNGGNVLGNFNNNRVELNLDSLPIHNTLKITFDLYIHDKWDGDYLIPGGNNIPDAWQMVLDGYQIHVTTFSNSNYGQSYPKNYVAGTPSNPARSDSWNTNLPGLCALKDSPNGSSLYKIEITTAHTSNVANISCNDALQPFGSFCLKSWSIDNLMVTAIQYK